MDLLLKIKITDYKDYADYTRDYKACIRDYSYVADPPFIWICNYIYICLSRQALISIFEEAVSCAFSCAFIKVRILQD